MMAGIRVGDHVHHKDGGHVCIVRWVGVLECKVRWAADFNAVRPNWYDRQTKEAWVYLPTKDLVKV